jgi:invasion protein IalB
MKQALLSSLIVAAGVIVATGAEAQQAAAGSPLLLVQSKDWSAVTAGSQKAKVCYALSKPTRSDPQTLNHGDVFFFISTRPGENVRNEPSIQVGYPFKEGSKVTVDVDGQKFNLFTRGDGAWVETPAEEAKLLDSLKKGRKLTVGGQSGRGNATTYTFSLSGLGGAVDAIAKECK